MGIATYADRMNGLSGSAVREILKLTQQPDMISFGGGMPSESAFPTEALKDIMGNMVTNLDGTVLQYGVTEGYVPLKEEIVKLMGNKGVDITSNHILVTSGSQQAIDLIGKAFINPGDKIIVESPTYLSAIQAFKLYEGNFISAPVDEEGIIPEQLAEILEQEKDAVKIIYTIPTFQNPTGKSIGTERRKQIMELAAKYDLLLIEDDPYGDLRYSGEALPLMKSFDTKGQCIYLGSFSKVVAPGLRVGYMIAEPEIISRVTIGKQASDVHTPVFSQMVIADFLAKGLLPDHLVKINNMYQEKRDVMLRCLEEHMPEGIKWTRPDGGLFIWVELPEGVVASELLLKAIERKVAFVPGDSFFAEQVKTNTIRLNFSNASIENIEYGMKVLGEVIKDYLA